VTRNVLIICCYEPAQSNPLPHKLFTDDYLQIVDCGVSKSSAQFDIYIYIYYFFYLKASKFLHIFIQSVSS